MPSRQSLADLASDMTLMASAIENYLDDLAELSITPDDVAFIRNQSERLRQLQAEQDNLTAIKKAKTAELQREKELARRKKAALKNRIKLIIPRSQWVAFGITAKK